jgi:hypothetical protein
MVIMKDLHPVQSVTPEEAEAIKAAQELNALMEKERPETNTLYVDPLTGGKKGMKLARHGLIPAWPLEQIAKVYGFGAQKYDDNNWRKGYPWGLSLDALGRHIEEWRQGRKEDPESGLHPLAHAAFHLLALMEFEHKNLGTDNRRDF